MPDAAEYRALRLEGLHAHPEAFGASWDDEAARPLAWFEDRLRSSAVFGGFRVPEELMGGERAGGERAGGKLAGVAGLMVPDSPKSRHKGVLWGMFVRPGARGTGLAAALVTRILEHAAGTVEAVRLTVVATNAPAVRLYTSAGFSQYGLERRALKVGEQYYDELLMTRPV